MTSFQNRIALNNSFVFIFAFLITFMPMVLYSINGIQDPYLSNHVASMDKYADVDHIIIEETFFNHIPGYGFFIIILANIMGLSPSELQFAPICGVPLIISILALSNRLFKSSVIALSLAVLIIYKAGLMSYSIWPHGFGFLFYYLFLNMNYLILAKKKVEYILVLILLFISNHFMSYTAELWMLSFSVITTIVSYMFISHKTNKNNLTSLPISFLVIFLGFNHLIYQKLPSLHLNDVFSSTNLFFNRYASLLSSTTEVPEKYVFRSEYSPIYFWSNSLYILLILFPIFLYIIREFRNYRQYTTREVFWISLFTVSVIDMFVYALNGVIPLRYILLFFPILSAMSIKKIKINLKNLMFVFLSFLIITAISSFYTSWTSSSFIKSTSGYSEYDASANWYLKSTNLHNNSITDHYTGGRYEIVATSEHVDFTYRFHDEKTYGHLVEVNYSKVKNGYFKGKYIIINNKNINKRTWAGGWKDYEPLGLYMSSINNNININKIYDDNIIFLFKG